MDTRQVANALGTEPKELRRFIRSDACTFTPVGSGGRYDFNQADIPALTEQFRKWSAGQGAKAPRKPTTPRSARRGASDHTDSDRAVWDDEGPVVIPDINDPRVRADVRRKAAEAEARLNEQLIAAGLHITNGFVGHRA